MTMSLVLSRFLNGNGNWGGTTRHWLRGFAVCWVAALCLAGAHGADPISITVAPATQKTFGNTIVWRAAAPSGANLVIKAKPDVFAQTKTVTIQWKGFQATDQVFPTPPPGPGSVQLGAGGEASVPLVFGKDSHKQWYITACVKWQPPGYDHKIDGCVYAYLEGIDPIASNAGNLIKIVSPAHPGPAHNWVKIPMQGNSIGVSVQSDALAKSNDKVVRFKYVSSNSTNQPGTSWPAPTEKTTPKTISLSGAASQGGWTQKSEPLTPDPNMGEWFTVKACLTLEYSGELCSDSYAYQLTKPKLKPGMDPNPVLDPGKQPPLPPPGGGSGSGQADKSENLPAGRANMMSPPPVLGVPAAATPATAASVPPGRPASPTLAPTQIGPAAPVDPRMMALPQVPGCTALPGRTGEFSCTTPDAAAGCERLRASPASGVSACLSSGGRLRR